MVADLAVEAERQFEAHDWGADAKWQERLSQMFISASVDPQVAVVKAKRKYFRGAVNEHLDLEPAPQRTTRSGPDPDDAPQSSTRRAVIITCNYVRLAANVLVLLFTLGFIATVSSPGLNAVVFRLLVLCGIVNGAIHVLTTHGKPKMDAAYAQRLFFDEEMHFLMLDFALIAAYPTLVPILPIFCRSGLFVASALDRAILPMFAPGLHARLSSTLSWIGSKKTALDNWCASLDILTGISFVLGILSQHRQVLVTVLVWQYLRVRYMFSTPARLAFQSFRQTCDGALLSPRCPGLIQAAYRKVCAWAYSTVDPEQARARHEQLQGAKCTIM